MRENRRIHVIARGSTRWAILREGLSRASRVYFTRMTAIHKAIDAVGDNGQVVVHNTDGKIDRIITVEKAKYAKPDVCSPS